MKSIEKLLTYIICLISWTTGLVSGLWWNVEGLFTWHLPIILLLTVVGIILLIKIEGS